MRMINVKVGYVGTGISFEKMSFCAEVEFDSFLNQEMAKLSWVNGPVVANSWVPLGFGWRFIAREARHLKTFARIH